MEGCEAKKAGDATTEVILGEKRTQIMEGLDALELAGSFAVATSLPGAMIQLAWAMSNIKTLTDNIETNERLGQPKYDVLEYANRIERQLKSIADVLVPSLRKDYEPIRKIVETYANFGEEHPNWLLKIDDWANQGQLDLQQEKQVEANATVLQ